MALRWRDKRYSTGVDEIDAENHQLFEHIGNFLNAGDAGDRRQEMDRLIGFLANYAGDYFPREEAIMEQYNCPVRDENRQDHELFRATLGSLHDRYMQEGMTELLREDVMALAVQWLETHVARVDSQLRNSRR